MEYVVVYSMSTDGYEIFGASILDILHIPGNVTDEELNAYMKRNYDNGVEWEKSSLTTIEWRNVPTLVEKE